jgi:putative transposase
MNYASALTNSQWQFIEHLFNNERKRKHCLRSILDAIFYLLKTGCQWRMLPKEYGPWQSVYYYYRKWKGDSLIEEVLDFLRAHERKKHGKEKTPSVAIIDSQSVKTASKAIDKGYDGNKKIKGRKRHIAVDTLGILLAVVVHSATVHDSQKAMELLDKLKHYFHRLKVIFADSAYIGELIEKVKKAFGWTLIVIKRNSQQNKPGFTPLPKRWIVERTFGWFERQRRLAKDYEYLTDTSETMVQLAMIRILLNRIIL